MSFINVLSKEVSELIAAGEVIERPSSVIKELVENSIDSGARHITVEIKNGGTTYIRVTDDGCGMSFEDVPTAFIRHATSKIREKEDLDKILTLGFRGEALASVSAVSRAEVMTKQKNDEYGTIYRIEGSIETLHEKSGCPDGTTMIIRDLFYNVPARRKFMKKDASESNAVSQILQKITMSHPEIAFKFIRDNKIEFNSSGDGELYSAVYAIYGREFANGLIPVEYEYNRVKVSGYIMKPLYSRKNRSFQNFFVNGRFVKTILCSRALESAYQNMIMTGKYPACIIMLDVPPDSMDVNIHPAKAEVRFTDEKTVTDAVYFAVKNAMINDGLLYELEVKPPVDWTAPVVKEEEAVQQEFLFTPVDEIEEAERKLEELKAAETKLEKHISDKMAEELLGSETAAKVQDEVLYFADDAEEKGNSAPAAKEEIEKLPEPVAEPEKEAEEAVGGFRFINAGSLKKQPEKPQQQVQSVSPKEGEPVRSEWTEKPKIRVVGEVFGVYIIAETDDKKMVMIDKHAAHERILFEKLKSRNCRQYSQMLMNGVKVLLTAEELSALEENVELLADMGFVFDFSESPCVCATAVPTFIMELDMEEIIAEIAENLCMHSRSPQSHTLDDMLHTVACKSAIKGNDKNDMLELQKLAEEVYSNEAIRHCPHGRPVMFTLSRSNIEHQFGRT